MGLSFHGVEKSYAVYDRPQDRLWEWVLRQRRHRMHVALTGVEFAVQPGETFGLVGENGAGKSTLLKIAAGTIRPTKGEVRRDGRIAALLELGAGFHPEESGYDNMRFMAALHGLEGDAMSAFVESAVTFSELSDESLKRPVKTYSSGMFMRLAFAGATAVEPQILIVDEALSVGDMHFQKKSLDRILALRDRGATILFCSHNLYQVRSLCQRAAWIHGGLVQEMGPTEGVVTAYEAHERRRYIHLRQDVPPVPSTESEGAAHIGSEVIQGGVPLVKFLSLKTETAEGVNMSQLESFEDMSVEIEVESYTSDPFHVALAIVRPDKDNVFGTGTQMRADKQVLSGVGRHIVRVRFPAIALLSGKYLWSVYVLDDSGFQVIDMAELIQPFTVLNRTRQEFGLVMLDHEWLSPPLGVNNSHVSSPVDQGGRI
ncbi:ABC transporter ATP-binding protein [Ottowia sp. GY511]|uniref:ABC transporter ATP-binding protein n=1 Tax=Ottowia flava TaxID=2675430 RepID=A0ABW4KQ67_9BURK|nr:ABC transporter ATP-binding protein [Ottowia sp. GY511]TXK32963.1 ABC transporter ATP-binding protein [Ottowia sp. GY511]